MLKRNKMTVGIKIRYVAGGTGRLLPGTIYSIPTGDSVQIVNIAPEAGGAVLARFDDEIFKAKEVET